MQFAAECTKELKTRQVLVQFDLRFLTGQVAKKLDCPVKNRTPGNPSDNPLLGHESFMLWLVIAVEAGIQC